MVLATINTDVNVEIQIKDVKLRNEIMVLF